MKTSLHKIFLVVLYSILAITFLPFFYALFSFFELKAAIEVLDKMPYSQLFNDNFLLFYIFITWFLAGMILLGHGQKIHNRIGLVFMLMPILIPVAFFIYLVIWVLLGNDL